MQIYETFITKPTVYSKKKHRNNKKGFWLDNNPLILYFCKKEHIIK